MKSIALRFLLVMCGALIAGSMAFAQDYGAPDSAYFLEPTFADNACTDATVGFKLWTNHDPEGFVVYIAFEFTWSGSTCIDSVVASPLPCLPLPDECGPYEELLYVSIDCDAKQGTVEYFCPLVALDCGVLICEFKLPVRPDSTAQINIVPGSIVLDTWYSAWEPDYQDLAVTLTAPAPPAMMYGDANGSRAVDIDDAVYLIAYIFAGGCPPWHFNSGDADASCAIDTRYIQKLWIE
ncbi:MAG: hypothetical protein KKH67_05865 [candidate division Zixibacteria bacterium]|nr:hypothetical protein [candidate division Zixibacteria bacterium]MBU1471403.1 hypothetical protein [candidate division Zixibacteria bacterium]